MKRLWVRILVGVGSAIVLVFVMWSLAIGPEAVWRVLTHGTTTVWDHLEYPGREFGPSSSPYPWPSPSETFDPSAVVLDGDQLELEDLLHDTGTLGFVVVANGELAYEWYDPDHGPNHPSMVFSVSKSILSLLIGAAIDDGIIGSVTDPVTRYVPEMESSGFGEVTIQDLLRMDSNLDYVEGDNPFGIHVEFNYSGDLTGDILRLRLRDEPDDVFRYKSGDNALLGLVLDRALGDRSITAYFQTRLWEPIGAATGGVWSTDHDDGLERTWCCLAVTARDLALVGQLVLQDGAWSGVDILSPGWVEASFEPWYPPARWPTDYQDSPLSSFGYQWWITDQEAWVALGKNGQYLYVDPVSNVVIVRLGERRGDHSWLAVFEQVAAG